jgi:hypothetical protein
MKTAKQTTGKGGRRKPRTSSRFQDDPFQCGYLRAKRILKIAPPVRWGHYSIAGTSERFEGEM